MTRLDRISPAALQKRVDAYFDRADKREEPYSITGLALYLGVTRACLTNHSKRDDIAHVIEYAKLRCENVLEKRMIDGAPPTGMIFILKNNYGWTDKMEIDQTISGTVSLSSLFDKAEELKEQKEQPIPIEAEIIEDDDEELTLFD